MDEYLTDQELRHIRVSQAWLGVFLQLCFDHTTVTDWRISGWILDISNLFTSALNHHEELIYDPVSNEFSGCTELAEPSRANRINALKRLISREDGVGFGAGNETLRKYVSVIDAGENRDANHAYMDIWDADYLNAPKLTFIGRFDEPSFAEFRALFIRFMQAETQPEIDAFKHYVCTTYRKAG